MKEVEALSTRWLASVIDRLNSGITKGGFPKVFNDPVWGTTELMPWEVLLLDSPLTQRLRGVRQLGLAHLVYPGAGHDRLEHIKGVVEAADHMVNRLRRNAEHRTNFGSDPDAAIPETTDEERYVVRLAALLHDIGHGPFSHAIEPVVDQLYSKEFKTLGAVFRSFFEGCDNVSASEAIASLIVLSDSMASVFNAADYEFPGTKKDLQMRVVARIVGARSHLKASYLSGIISGPVDADKFDYMIRDSHHAGLPIGLDTDRLISKLEVITITPDNAPATMVELRDRAERSDHKRIYEMGISLSGIGSYEQMMVGRVLLYDRLYYHHKVRAADAMAQRLVNTAEREREAPFTLQELFLGVSDDTMIQVLGGLLQSDMVKGGGEGAKALANRLMERRLYHRATAFAARFIAGLDGLSEKDCDSERGALWRNPTKSLSSIDGIQAFEKKIYETALEIAPHIENLQEQAADLRQEHIIVDLPLNKIKPGGNLLLTRTENDQIGLPNFFFDPERWSNAYDQQKRCGYVFCPKERIPLVALAAKIAIFREYRFGLSETADRFTKTVDVIEPEWFDKLAAASVIDTECHEQLKDVRTFLSLIKAEDISLPEDWVREAPRLAESIAKNLKKYHPGGFAPTVKNELLSAITALANVVATICKHGKFSKYDALDERRELQPEIRDMLSAQGLAVSEETELVGGRTDLISGASMLIENKVAGETDNVMEKGSSSYPFQTRRYAIALCNTVFFTVVAYKNKTEAGLLQQCESIKVIKVPSVKGDFIEIRFAVPYGTGRPSAAKA